MKQSEGLLLKPEILNGETATSVWDIITTKKLLETMNTVFFPLPSSHARQNSRIRTDMYFVALHDAQLRQQNKNNNGVGADSGTVSTTAEFIF